MSDQYTYGDLLMALAIDVEVKRNTLRLFLYLDSLILSENGDVVRHVTPTENCCITTSEIIMKILDLTKDEYEESKKFLLEHNILICQELSGKDIWGKQENNRWFLKSLGPNLADVKNIHEPEIEMNNFIFEQLSKPPSP